jgi:Polyketide cyclase / dehydrase and lipid transport
MGADVTVGTMRSARRQAMVDAPVEAVWELIGDVNRHPEWWPRVEEVECDLLEVGATYRQVTRRPDKTLETTMKIEELDDCHELRLSCLNTGMYAHFLLTPAQDGTFVDAELGVEEQGLAGLLAAAFVRRWITQSLDGLRRAASSAATVREQPGEERGEQAAAQDG